MKIFISMSQFKEAQFKLFQPQNIAQTTHQYSCKIILLIEISNVITSKSLIFCKADLQFRVYYSTKYHYYQSTKYWK